MNVLTRRTLTSFQFVRPVAKFIRKPLKKQFKAVDRASDPTDPRFLFS